jgi:tRNA/tmRNA/rRNA uracil-C5-methylase (TrmA/RlmC/RlmD family)
VATGGVAASGDPAGSGNIAASGDWLDRIVELDVGPVAHGGHCVARHEGRVVFVRYALPGERVRAVVTEDRQASFCRADTITVLTASPDRVEPPCVWARPGGCGGCDFQHASFDAQHELKADVLAEQLRRMAGLDLRVPVEELPGGPLGWRGRVRLAVDRDGTPGLRPHRGHDVIPVDGCPLTPDGLLDGVLDRRWTPGRDIEVARDADGSTAVEADTTQVLNGRQWRIGPGMFWQVHPALAATLCDVLRDWTPEIPGGVAWDLYGGAGVLATVLADLVGSDGTVTVVESDRRAVAAGQAALADLPQVGWVTGRVEQVLAAASAAGLAGPPDVVVADPPRRGLGREVVHALVDAAPGRVVYVACDPASLARDLASFAARGYRLTELRAFDAFPMTHHFESVALLEPAT